MAQLVLAIEPDTRQAAIVKRIVREKVLADVAVVDSRDAALEAMRTTIPDVLLLSALLSPRDEDELIAHLRTLRDAEHLQTHTIPQLASTIGDQDEKPARGWFGRKKGRESAPAGCDPDLFAEEIRTYLKHASDKRRQVRDGGPIAPIAVASSPASRPAPAPKTETVAAEEPASAGSSWESPFEWRPTSSRSQPAPPPPEPESRFEPEPFTPEPLMADRESVIADPAVFDPPIAGRETDDAFAEAFGDAPTQVSEPAAAVEPEHAYRDFTTDDRYAEPADTRAASYDSSPTLHDSYSSSPSSSWTSSSSTSSSLSRVKYPLSVRAAKGWWFVEGKFTVRKDARVEGEPDSELHEVLASLAVPKMIAGVSYADGCRIRRVRLSAA